MGSICFWCRADHQGQVCPAFTLRQKFREADARRKKLDLWHKIISGPLFVGAMTATVTMITRDVYWPYTLASGVVGLALLCLGILLSMEMKKCFSVMMKCVEESEGRRIE